MHHVNIENWTFCRYKSGNFLAMVTFGMDPEGAEMGRFEYYVTVIESEEREVFQQTFSTLANACLFLNEKYGDWDFENQTAQKSGCSSCAAH